MTYRVNKQAAQREAAINKRRQRNEVILSILGGIALAAMWVGLCFIEQLIG